MAGLISILIWLYGIYCFIMLIFFHEYGHAWLAKKQGIYRGWKIGFWGPEIKLSRPFKSRWDYLSGVWGSLLAYPLFIMLGVVSTVAFDAIIWFPLFALSLAVMDIIAVIFYKESWKYVTDEQWEKIKKE